MPMSVLIKLSALYFDTFVEFLLLLTIFFFLFHRNGRLDAYLGDYPILDYARAHLAPSCELKLVSKIFGDDQYGLGVPKDSPLKVR